jgi:hypothetical protein
MPAQQAGRAHRIGPGLRLRLRFAVSWLALGPEEPGLGRVRVLGLRCCLAPTHGILCGICGIFRASGLLNSAQPQCTVCSAQC